MSFSQAARPLLNSARLRANEAVIVRPSKTSSANLTRLSDSLDEDAAAAMAQCGFAFQGAVGASGESRPCVNLDHSRRPPRCQCAVQGGPFWPRAGGQLAAAKLIAFCFRFKSSRANGNPERRDSSWCSRDRKGQGSGNA